MKSTPFAVVVAVVFVFCALAMAQTDSPLHHKAVQGDPKAQTRLALEHSKTGNHKEAVKWFRAAAEQGEVYAQYELSLHYGNGEGVQKDDSEAFKWCNKAAQQGFIYAQNSLAICYTEGIGTPRDASEAAKWFRKAAEQGLSEAQFKLGRMYFVGEGVEKNAVEAARWFRMAAEQGNATAQQVLGLAFANGDGMPKDFTEAFKWLARSAEQGLAIAQLNLGSLYANGQGVSEDMVQAYKWMTVSAAQGNKEAARGVQALEPFVTSEQRAEGLRLAQEFRPRVESVSDRPVIDRPGADSSLFDVFHLKHGVSIRIPKHWQIIESQLMKQIDTNTEVLSGVGQGDNQILIASNYYDGRNTFPSASARVSMRIKESLSQSAIEAMRQEDLDILSTQGHQVALSALAKSGDSMTKITRYVTSKEKLAGFWAIRSDYQEITPSLTRAVSIYVISMGNRSVKLTLSYDTAQSSVLSATINEIRNSLQIASDNMLFGEDAKGGKGD